MRRNICRRNQDDMGKKAAFCNRQTLGATIASSVSIAAASLLVAATPAHAQDGQCRATLSKGPIRSSLVEMDSKTSAVVLRFPVKGGGHGTLRIPGPFVEGLIEESMELPEAERATMLSNVFSLNLAAAEDRLASTITATLPCISGTPPIKTLLASAKSVSSDINALRKRTGVSAATKREAAAAGKTLVSAGRSRDPLRIDAALRKARAVVEKMRTQIKSSDQNLRSGALIRAAELREGAAKVKSGKAKTSALRLASQLEAEAKRGSIRPGALAGRIRSAEAAIGKLRDLVVDTTDVGTEDAIETKVAAKGPTPMPKGVRAEKGRFFYSLPMKGRGVAAERIEVPITLVAPGPGLTVRMKVQLSAWHLSKGQYTKTSSKISGVAAKLFKRQFEKAHPGKMYEPIHFRDALRQIPANLDQMIRNPGLPHEVRVYLGTAKARDEEPRPNLEP